MHILYVMLENRHTKKVNVKVRKNIKSHGIAVSSGRSTKQNVESQVEHEWNTNTKEDKDKKSQKYK